MEEVDIEVITKRSIHGVVALVSRTFTIQIVSFASNFLLTIFLSPAVFGVFFVVSAAIAFLSYFSDIGLAAALIQKKDAITEEELRTTFTIQQFLVIAVVIVALSLSSAIGSFYHLETEGIRLYQALVIAFFLSSLKTVPSIILERNLKYERLVIPQIVETFLFSVVAVVLAIKGFGITSFTFAVLARGLSGVIAIYVIQPWKMGLGFSKKAARELLSFGIPFQANSFLALIKDDLFVAYIGKILPLSQVGYVGFAQKWAFTPLRLIMDNVIRITFPSFARLQEHKDLLAKAIEKSIFAASFVIFPSLVGLVALGPYFINVIPKYSKWEPALLSLTFFAGNAAFSSISTPLTNALNAIGKIKITLYFMIFWTFATWVLTPLAIFLWGFNGVALASFVISVSVVIVVYITKKYIDFSLVNNIKYPFLSSALMGLLIYLLSPMVVKNLIGVLSMIVLGGIFYLALIFFMARAEMLDNIALIKRNLKR